MGLDEEDFVLGSLLAFGALFVGGHRRLKKAEKAMEKETKKRRGMPISWPDELNQEVFEEICRKVAKSIRRLKIKSFDGLYISCEVKASSGLSTWDFSADFYDYGKLSGRYFTGYVENTDSTIPIIFLEKVSESIKEILYKNKAFTPISSESALGENCYFIEDSFIRTGFTNVKRAPQKRNFWNLFTKKWSVTYVIVDGLSEFSKNQMFDKGSPVIIAYYC